MTEERSNSENDPLVTRAYREAATEKTPQALDDAVLREARQAVSGNGWLRYPKTIHWLRPMAWAATIGLSLAIVLELTMTPTEPELIMESLPVAPAAAPAERIDMRERQELDEAVENILADDTLELQKSRAADAPALASEAEVKQELERMLQFEEQVEARSAAEQPAAAEGVAAMRSSATYAIAVPCSEEEIETPATWLECIERLDEQGRYVDARRERERLAEAFPDFELPPPAN